MPLRLGKLAEFFKSRILFVSFQLPISVSALHTEPVPCARACQLASCAQLQQLAAGEWKMVHNREL